MPKNRQPETLDPRLHAAFGRNRNLALTVIAVCFWLAAPFARSAAAQQTDNGRPATRSAAVTAIAEPIIIDGALDEAAWRSAPKIGDLIQRQPEPGEAATERTEVMLLRDHDNLYIGVMAYDSDPAKVLGSQMARDGSLMADDRIEILLDTFRDQRSAFYFATNPAGALVDGLAFANGQLNTEWDAIWRVRTQRTSQGWVAEFAIPFKSLSFPAGEDIWGFNIARNIYRKLEDGRWSGARLETQFLQVSEAGEISNLAGLSQGIGLDVRPFIAGNWLHTGATGHDAVNRKPGFDVFYNITPSLKLTGSFKTDFAETEVDARQINLSRFSLLFPEKRSFFLEGAGVFSFASTGPEVPGGIPPTGADLFPFFSRRIGLIEGLEVPIDFGVKLTGTVGRNDIGILDVRTGDLRAGNTLVVDEKNFLVGRIKRNLFRQSYVGLIFTDGHPARDKSGQTYGADMRLATSRLLGRSRNFVVNAYGVRSANRGVSGNDWSYGFSAHYPNDKVLAQVAFKEVQKNFKPALGFVQRENVQMLRLAASYNPRPKNFLNIQQMFHDFFYTRFTRLDNHEVESWDFYATVLDWHYKSGDSTHAIMDFNPTYERLFAKFEIAPGVVLMPGEYRFTRFRVSPIMSASKRRVAGGMTLVWGNYWSGKAEQVLANLSFKMPPWFSIGLSTNQTFARLPEGKFITRIVTSNIAYAVSPSLSFSNLIQYDNRSRNLGWQSRVRWTLEPGRDLFLAFNQGWIQDEATNRQFRSQDTKLSAKFQYSIRF
jgi:uncharacterized protein DUF5916/cellulose/xylan binding protein with CBM9 domain